MSERERIETMKTEIEIQKTLAEITGSGNVYVCAAVSCEPAPPVRLAYVATDDQGRRICEGSVLVQVMAYASHFTSKYGKVLVEGDCLIRHAGRDFSNEGQSELLPFRTHQEIHVY